MYLRAIQPKANGYNKRTTADPGPDLLLTERTKHRQVTYTTLLKRSYSPPSPYGTFSVVDSAGREVAFLKSGWLQVGSQDYSFIVPVGGLKKGKYFVQIMTPGGTLGRREFEI